MKTIRLLFVTLLAMAGPLFNSQAQIQTQGNLLVDLDPTNATVLTNFATNGAFTGFVMAVTNTGTLGGFFESIGDVSTTNNYTNFVITNTDVPQILNVGGGPLAFQFNGRQHLESLSSIAITNGATTNAAAALGAPAAITGTNPAVSIEVWCFNPTVSDEERMVSWGTTAAAGTLMSFSYGAGGTQPGAVNRNAGMTAPFSTLAGPNLSWGGAYPPAAAWHHLVYTFSGATRVNKLYQDGQLVVTSTNITDVVTTVGTNITIATGRGNAAINGVNNAVRASMFIAKVRVMDGVLSDANVLNNYLFDIAKYTNAPAVLSSGPTHRWSFNNAALADAVGSTVIDSVGGANGTIGGIAATGSASFDGSKLRLSGGFPNGTFAGAYVDLPNGLLSANSVSNAGSGAVTLEGWCTFADAYNWQTVLNFGSTTNGEQTTPGITSGTPYDGADYINFGVNAANLDLMRFETLSRGYNGSPGQINQTFSFVYDFTANTHDLVPFSLKHWAVTWDEASNIINLYVNGVAVGRMKSHMKMNQIHDLDCWLGRSAWRADGYMSGTYDEFRIYNYVLSAAQIANDYRYGPDIVLTNLGDLGTVASVAIQPIRNTNIWVGITSDLQVNANYTGSGMNNIDVTSVPGIFYSSSASNIATVSSNGQVRFVAAGSATITASFGGQSDNKTYVVSNAVPAIIHRWTFNTNDASTVADDIVGGPSWQASISGSIVLSNKAQLASGAYVSFPANVLSGNETISLELWVDVLSNANNNMFWAFGDTNPQGNGRRYIFASEKANLRTAISDVDVGFSREQNAQIGGNIDNTLNRHIVGVYNPFGGYIQMYLDGRLGAQISANTPLAGISGVLNYLGKSLYTADPAFTANIDEFRVWNGPLSPQQVAINTTAGPNSVVTSPGTLLSISLSVANTNTIKTVAQQAVFVGNFVNISGVNLFNYGETNAVVVSDNTNVVTVSASGLVTAVGQGTAHIIGTYGGFSATNTIFVADPAPTLVHRYTFNTNANDVVGTAHGSFQGSANTNGLGQAVLNAASGDYVLLPPGVISNLFAITIEAFASFGTNTSGSWLYGFGDQSPATFQGRNYVYYSPHIGNNARTGISSTDPGTAGEQNATANGGQLDNRNNVAITVVTHPFLGFEQLYLNGALVANNTNVTTLLSTVSPNLGYIGRSLYDVATGPYPAQSYLNATIDDFRIYSGVLTSNQIAIDAAAGPNSIITNTGAFVSVGIILPTNTIPYQSNETIAVVGNFANVSNVNLFTYGGLGAVTVTSSDTNVVTVGTAGLLTAVASGTVNIIASVTNVSVTNKLTVLGSRNLVLKNRWSFTTDASDSVGGQNGTLMGTASVSGGSLVLPGGANGTAYVNLPNGIISSKTNVTFEVWARRNAVATWARLFDFGNSDQAENTPGGGVSYAFLTTDNGGNVPRFAYSTNGPGPEAPILTAGAGIANAVTNVYTVVFDFTSNFSAFYINGAQAAAGTTPTPLSLVSDVNDWIGRSQYSGDPDFNGTIDEIRIWEGRMFPSEILQAVTNGPNALPLPVLSFTNSSSSITLTWPYSMARYTLQSSPSLSTPVWTAITNSPVTTNGIRRVTLPISGSASFFRLSDYASGQ